MPFEDEIANKLPMSLRVVSLIWAIMVILSVLTIHKGPEDLRKERESANNNGQPNTHDTNKKFSSVYKYLKTK